MDNEGKIMKKIKAKAPTRIDFAGGTLDLWPLHHMLSHKCTVNVGVSLYANVEVSFSEDLNYELHSLDQGKRCQGTFLEICENKTLWLLSVLLEALWDSELPPLMIKTQAGSPKGAGLGGSSSLGIAFAGVLNYVKHKLRGDKLLSEYELVHLVANAEAKILRIPTGTQDHWGAIRGALNVVRYPLLGELVETFPNRFPKLSESLLLCYSGESRVSGNTNWQFYKQAIDGNESALSFLEALGTCAEECAEAVIGQNYELFVESSLKEWKLRKEFFPHCDTKRTMMLQELAFKKGATFSRVCGAGGGGVILILAPQKAHREIRKHLEDHGASLLDAQPVHRGLEIWEE